MYKTGFITSFLPIIVVTISFSQKRYTQNPFSKLKFLKGYADTTIIASYSGVNNDIGISNKSIIETITKHTGEKIRKLNYSIDLKIGNYPPLSVACSDKSMFEPLRLNVAKITQVRIKCIVYRFYFFDGICNFFYIDKVSVL